MNDNPKGQSFSSLPRPQKTAVIILAIAALGILVVWFWQFNMRINSPFRPTNQQIAQGKKADQDKIIAENALRTKDSDGDSLTDYDEINIYKTSPYLEDTDGDGIPDGEEIRLGQNPLCNEKTGVGDCSPTLAATSSIQVISGTNSVATSSPASNVDQTLLIKALSGEGDANTMRQILLQGGANPEQVKVLTDQDLMTMYTEILKSQNPDIIISTSTATSSNIN